MPHLTRTATLTLSVLLAFTLAACGSDDNSSQPTKPLTSRAATQQTTTAASPTSSTNPDGTARPGTEAKLGQPTLLTYDTGDRKGILQVTVTRIEKGSRADLEKLSGLSGDALKATPYYVHSVIKNAGTTDLSHSAIDPPTGLLKDGTAARELLVIGTFDRCDSYPKTKKFGPSASYETCAPVLADPGTTVTGAVWTGSGYPDFPASSGVTWTP